VSALLTDMNQPLAPAAGNALEVLCAIDYLTGKSRPARLHEVTLALCAEGLVAAQLAPGLDAARAKLEAALDSGAAAERFARMISLLGGPSDLLEHPEKHLAKAPVVRDIRSRASGTITGLDTRALGLAVVALGGGRLRSDQEIDPAVGLAGIVELGTQVEAGQSLMKIHARTEDDAKTAEKMILEAIEIGNRTAQEYPLVRKRITASDIPGAVQ